MVDNWFMRPKPSSCLLEKFTAERRELGHQEMGVKDHLRMCPSSQRVCMKGISQFRLPTGDKGQGHGQVIFAHSGLEIGK